MRSPIEPYLTSIVDEIRPHDSGALADYIPELADADPAPFGIALSMLDGQVYTAGDAERPFTIQSSAKAFTYALAIRERGLTKVLAHVGVAPSGDAFNAISVDETGRPANPMINAGAIGTFALVPGETEEEKFGTVWRFISDCAGHDLDIDEGAYSSELSTAYRNRGIANMLRASGGLAAEPDVAVEGYIRQGALQVCAKDLALMGATLASGGIQPVTGKRVLDEDTAGHVLSVMTTCGMYDAAGDWVSSVGIPAKSGVGGGIVGASPGRLGIATFSPRLDVHGNSVRGVATFERLSRDLSLHLMRIPETGHLALREAISVDYISNDYGTAAMYRLQGSIDFVAAESVVRRMSSDQVDHRYVVVDLTEVAEVKLVALLMIAKVMAGFADEGRHVYLIDPARLYGPDDLERFDIADKVTQVDNFEQGEEIGREREAAEAAG